MTKNRLKREIVDFSSLAFISFKTQFLQVRIQDLQTLVIFNTSF